MRTIYLNVLLILIFAVVACNGMGRVRIGKPNDTSIPGPTGPITQSLVFTRANSNNLSMSAANFGTYDKRTFSFGYWFKDVSVGIHRFGHAHSNGNPAAGGNWAFFGDINPSNHDEFETFQTDGTVVYGHIEGTTAYTDTASWHYIKFDVDLNQSDQTNRMVMTVDSVRTTSFTTASWPDGVNPVYTSATDVSFGGNSPDSNPGSAHYWPDGNRCMIFLFSGRIPTTNELVNSGANTPRDFHTNANLFSLIRGDESVIGTDQILKTAWTNGTSFSGSHLVTQSSDHP